MVLAKSHFQRRPAKRPLNIRKTKWVGPKYVRHTFEAVRLARRIGSIKKASSVYTFKIEGQPDEKIPNRTLRRYVHLSYNRELSLAKFGVYDPIQPGEEMLIQTPPKPLHKNKKDTTNPFDIVYTYLDAIEALKAFERTLPPDYLTWKLRNNVQSCLTKSQIRRLRVLEKEVQRTAALCV